jgi:Ca-activated chloride channel family protein
VPTQSYQIQQLAVNASVEDQIAKVQVSQTFVNTGSRQMEVCFVFPLPYDGAVDRMTFLVDGKEYAAELMGAEEARRIYEGYVRRNRDPALLEWMGTGMFKTSVFPVPAGAKRTVTLRYNQLCRKQDGLTEFLLPLSTAKYTSRPVEEVTVRVAIRSTAKIKNVYSPTHEVDKERSSSRNVVVQYTSSNEVPSADFRLMYDVGDAPVGASLLSYRPSPTEDGYFLLLVSPEIRAQEDTSMRKTVVFVVDRSGSMSGKKIEQARAALRFVLNNLHEGDLFNIIAYDSEVESFREELQRFSDKTRREAIGFVEGLYAGGSTNIDGALRKALSQLQDKSQPNYVVFLTDGLPTAGERSESKIVANAEQHNRIRARLFSFGVGYDVNSRLLDRLSRACLGQSQYVRPNEDIEVHVSRLYRRIGAPVLTDLDIGMTMKNFPKEKGKLVNRVYPRDARDLFAGDQLVLVGRYKQGGQTRISLKGKVAGETQKFTFQEKLTKHSSDESQAFIEKLWAMRRVGEIIDEIDLSGRNQELIDELVALSKRHGIMTPYTSFLADDIADGMDLAQSRRRAGDALEALEEESGQLGFAQRDYKATLQRAAQPAPAAGAGYGGMAGGTTSWNIAEDREVRIQNVQQIGRKTFFLRNGRWIDSTLTEDLERNVQRLERYSTEYFDLLRRHGRHIAKYLAMEGEVTLVLDGQAYAFGER